MIYTVNLGNRLKLRECFQNETLCAIWYGLCNFDNVKITRGGVAEASNVTQSITLPWVFFTFLKLY